MFEGGQRDTPTPYHSTFSPVRRTISTFEIIPSVTRREVIERTVMSYNTPYQVGSHAGCVGVDTRASETGFGRAGKRQEVAINIRTGSH